MKKTTKQTCRECNLWDIEAAKDKVGRIHKDSLARCLWVSTYIFPTSVLTVRAGYMEAQDGEGCKFFVSREK